jgi:hypothetical protein
MEQLPNLGGFADPQNVSKKGTGKFTADYINWSRTLHDIRQEAPGWMPEMQQDIDGNEIHKAPDGSCYLVIRFTHIDGTMTAGIPHAIMDHKMQPLAGDRIGARDVADSFVRGACKAAAGLFGYAWQLWSKDDPLERTTEEDEEVEKLRDIMSQPTQHVTERIPKDQEIVPDEDLVDPPAPDNDPDWLYDKVVWLGKQKYHKEMLGDIAKKDLNYLKGVLKNSYEVLAESNPDLLKAVEKVVSKYSENGEQDFRKAQ